MVGMHAVAPSAPFSYSTVHVFSRDRWLGCTSSEICSKGVQQSLTVFFQQIFGAYSSLDRPPPDLLATT
jgi:hypothetical protein